MSSKEILTMEQMIHKKHRKSAQTLALRGRGFIKRDIMQIFWSLNQKSLRANPPMPTPQQRISETSAGQREITIETANYNGTLAANRLK